MILCIADVLSAAELSDIGAALDDVPFVDGRSTAGWHARAAKRNRQADPSHRAVRASRAIVAQALERHPLFAMAVRPARIRPALFSRYEPGMAYATHVDDALMGGDPPMRTDVALTLFLNDPADYEGGALIIESASGEERFKLDAGAMVVYPASTLHRVEPVTRGLRLAAVTWVQSLVRDPGRREILFDLDTARRRLHDQHGKTPEFDLLAKTLANLLRMWAEP